MADWTSGNNDGSEWNDGSNNANWNESVPVSNNEVNDSLHSMNGAGDFGNGADGGGADDSCRNCGQEGHFARDCPEPRKMGACFNCGEEGHSKADCTKPRVFTGECRECGQKGHRASDCPSKPKVCAMCKAEGDHDTVDCNNNYSFDMNGIPDMTEGECWNLIKKASDEVDMDDFKDALKALQKSCPELTYPALEKQLRARNHRFYIIALDKDIGGAYTNVNLQGEINKKYAVSFFKSAKPPRPLMVAKWPKDPEDNLTRLTDAGQTLQRGLSYCNNCENFGHSRRQCDQDIVTPELTKITCALCGEDGHRVRDCNQERHKPREPRTCKNCGSEDHIAKECDQPRKLICNNCEKEGHIGKDCDQPRDWSKVTCRHCGEKGHSSDKRCKPGAVKLDADTNDENSATHDTAGMDGFDSGFGNVGNGNSGLDNGAGGGDWEKETSAGGDDWNTSAPATQSAW